MTRVLISALLLVACPLFGQKNKTQNVILVTLDGMRWQEVFNGADTTLMKQQEHLKDARLREKYWRTGLQSRREALFPFLWTTVAKQGQLFGNRQAGSLANVTNRQWFSYPGYNEILTGKADDERVDSNKKIYNPNINVLEFIQSKPGFAGKVAAFTSWDVFPYIINDKRNNILVSAGQVPVTQSPNDTEKLLNKLMMSIPNPLGTVRLDAFTFYYGLEYMKRTKPRVMYFGFDETDDFAHDGEYGAYLNSAHAIDAYLAELWDFVQNHPAYKGKTTMIITADHGRGSGAEDWRDHGIETPGADQIWLAMIGPDTPAVGEVKSRKIYQNQIAQTVASLLGFDFKTDARQGDAIGNN